jgi:hypothetical protein
MRRALCRAPILAGIALSAPALAGGSTHPADDAARAEQLFRQGTVAFEAGEYGEAYGVLRSAWDLAPGYRTAAALGQVELRLALHRDAAEHLTYCLLHFPAAGDPGARAHVEQGLARAREHVSALRIRVDVDGADLRVDASWEGRSPLDALVFVEPGTHVVAASREGFLGKSDAVVVRAGTTTDVSLSMVAAPGGPAAAPAGHARAVGAALPAAAGASGQGGLEAPRLAEPRAPASSGHEAGGLSPRGWLIVVGGSLSLISLGTAVVFDVKGASAARAMADLRAELGGAPGACAAGGSGPAALCAKLRDTTDERDADNSIATFAAVGGGVLAAATIGTALALGATGGPARSALARPLVRVSLTRQGGGVVMGGAF